MGRNQLFVSSILGALSAATLAQAQTIPTDAAGGCPISPATVASFFVSGTVTLNGVAKPADSTQVLTPNCGFFSWSEQMFLWMLSPAPATYGGSGPIMFSPKFFTVSPKDSTGRRTFEANNPGFPIRMILRTTELGPHMLPSLLSRSGHVIEVQRPVAGRPVPHTIRLQSGALATVTNVRRTAAGLQFFDAAGKPLLARKLVLPTIRRQAVLAPNGVIEHIVPVQAVQHAIQARKFIINGHPIFTDLNGNIIDVEPGQADDGVLLSQNNSLIYYITVVNDLYAYHRTMQGPADIGDSTTIVFPMTAADAAAVTTFAAGKGHTIVDPEALALESKSSWIEASAVSNPGDYLQVTATVPTFNKSNPDEWVPNGQKTVKLVMVGMHVVGSTNGHGEMVWGSFEHVGNAPNVAYQYSSTSGTKTVPQNTSGSWIFTPSGFGGTPNVTHASWNTGNGHIQGINPGTGSPPAPVASTPVIRMRPFGIDGSNIGLNTQVIAANASVISQLKPGDIRANYFQLGTTWTIGGASPSSGGVQVGTNQLANATIETFMQAQGSGPGSNCFSCHVFNTVATSHVYGDLKPLP
jgi:hypothetical protein